MDMNRLLSIIWIRFIKYYLLLGRNYFMIGFWTAVVWFAGKLIAWRTKMKIYFKFVIPLLFTGFLSTCGMDAASESFNAAQKKKFSHDLSFKGSLIEYKNSYDYFKKEMTGSELKGLWIKIFENYTYLMDGNLKDRKADCLSAYWFFFSKIGSNVILEKIPKIMDRVRKLNELNQINIYRDYGKVRNGGYQSVRVGDVIIFDRPKLSVPYHIGIVCGKNNGFVQYVEMEGVIGMANQAYVKFDNPDIAMIFSPSYAYWIGDGFNTDNVDGVTK